MTQIQAIEKFMNFLKAIQPYVVVCGSFARNEQTEDSDIDFYVRSKEWPEEEDPPIDQSYMPEVVEMTLQFGYEIESVIVGHISISKEETQVRQVEFSNLFKLPRKNPVREIEIYGIPFLACEDDKNVPYEVCWDQIDDYGNIVDSFQ